MGVFTRRNWIDGWLAVARPRNLIHGPANLARGHFNGRHLLPFRFASLVAEQLLRVLYGGCSQVLRLSVIFVLPCLYLSDADGFPVSLKAPLERI